MSDFTYTTATVRNLLDHLEDIFCPHQGRRFSDMPPNGGRQFYDGISSGRITKIMIEQAILALPKKLRLIIKARWISYYPLGVTLRMLGMTKDQYYYACDKAVDGIAYHLTGQTEKFNKAIRKYL